MLAVARLVDLVGALARPLSAGAGAAPGGAELVGTALADLHQHGVPEHGALA